MTSARPAKVLIIAENETLAATIEAKTAPPE